MEGTNAPHTETAIYLSGLPETHSKSRRRQAKQASPNSISYAALLRERFIVRCPSPFSRWSLTPPFHPYPRHCRWRFAFCYTICRRCFPNSKRPRKRATLRTVFPRLPALKFYRSEFLDWLAALRSSDFPHRQNYSFAARPSNGPSSI